MDQQPCNSSLPNISHIIYKYWDLLQLSKKKGVNFVHTYMSILARNIQDYIVKCSMQALNYSTDKYLFV